MWSKSLTSVVGVSCVYILHQFGAFLLLGCGIIQADKLWNPGLRHPSCLLIGWWNTQQHIWTHNVAVIFSKTTNLVKLFPVWHLCTCLFIRAATVRVCLWQSISVLFKHLLRVISHGSNQKSEQVPWFKWTETWPFCQWWIEKRWV